MATTTIFSKDDEELIIEELKIELKGKIDGGRKNIISTCPYCDKPDKFGVYIGKEYGRKKKFASNCFSCGAGSRELTPLLKHLNRLDILPSATADITSDFTPKKLLSRGGEEDEIDDEIFIVDLPEEYERTYESGYLEERGFEDRDYEYFPVGMSEYFKFFGYVIFPVMDNDDVVGYVSRHEWSKKKLEKYNKRAKKNDEYQILRYKNSTDNDFIKLLYNIDNVIEDQTITVIVVEGIFDVVAITRELNLYDNQHIAVVATFGKKISDVQILKLQEKGVENIVLMYDPDAVKEIRETSEKLDRYFNCLIADLPELDMDADDMDFWDFFDLFRFNLRTPVEYSMNKIQRKKLKI